MKVFIIKYALTEGIVEREVIQGENIPELVRYKPENGFTQYFHKKDYTLTREEAVVKAEEMRIRKLKSLDKQMKKISALKF